MSGARLQVEEQSELLGRIAGLVIAAWPPGTEQAVLDYGRMSAAADVRAPGTVRRPWPPPAEVWDMLRDLRNGMYSPDSGLWVSAKMIITPERYEIRYKWDRPRESTTD